MRRTHTHCTRAHQITPASWQPTATAAAVECIRHATSSSVRARALSLHCYVGRGGRRRWHSSRHVVHAPPKSECTQRQWQSQHKPTRCAVRCRPSETGTRVHPFRRPLADKSVAVDCGLHRTTYAAKQRRRRRRERKYGMTCVSKQRVRTNERAATAMTNMEVVRCVEQPHRTLRTLCTHARTCKRPAPTPSRSLCGMWRIKTTSHLVYSVLAVGVCACVCVS